jgi:SAM-dependent methyltransferase
MNFGLRVLRILRALSPRKRGPRYYYDKEDFSERWDDVAQLVDLRPSDIVLDMGCAEGLISFEVAKQVTHVDGVEVAPHRLERAVSRSRQDGVKNVSFTLGSVVDYDVSPKSYDVVLFLGVMGKPTGANRVGLAELDRMLAATRRQIIIRVNVQGQGNFHLYDILALMDQRDFDGICFLKREGHGNLIVGNRRGSDARLLSVPSLMVLPTKMTLHHPCLRDIPIAALDSADEISS